MKKTSSIPIRKKAEEEIAKRKSANAGKGPKQDTSNLLHELKVHQVELEMQNETLRSALGELAAAHARYFELYDLAPVGYCSVSERGLIVQVNLAAVTLLGAARDALLGQQLAHFVSAQDQDVYYRHRKQLFESGASLSCELRLAKRAGGERWVRVVSVLAHDAAGAPLMRAGLIDIDEFMQATQALEKSERLLRDSQAAASIGSYINDLAAGTYEGTPVLDAVFGITKEYPHTNEGWVRLMHADCMQPMKEALLRSIGQKLPFDEEYRIIRPSDGAERWIHGLGKVSYAADGNARSLVGTVQDITERKRLESQRFEAAARLEQVMREQAAVLDSEVVGIVKTRARIIEWCNAAFEHMLGYATGDLQGKPTHLVYADEAAYRTLGEAAARVLRDGGALRTELRFMRRDGSVGWSDVTGTRLRPDAADLIWSLIDITDRKNAQIAEQAAAQRLSALSRRLIEVQEEERAHIARELHDEIGQVLTAVRLHLKVVEREDTTGKHRKSMNNALNVVERAIVQVRGMSLKLRPPALDDQGLVAALHSLVEQQPTSPGLRIRVEAPLNDIALPRGVAEACYRVAQESLTNLLRYAAAEQALIRVECGADSVAVSICDDGRGFDVDGARARRVRTARHGRTRQARRRQAVGALDARGGDRSAR